MGLDWWHIYKSARKLTNMTSKKPHEMTFIQFAQAISPGWSTRVKFPLKDGLCDPKWITSVWDSTENGTDYGVYWHNQALANQLPSDAQRYRFDDFFLHPFTEKLGLNPSVSADNVKAAQLLATRNAWIAAIQDYYGQYSPNLGITMLSRGAAAEYLLLTSGVIHPWMEKEVRLYITEQKEKKLQEANIPKAPIEMSSNPNWPNTQVIYARTSEPTAQQRAELAERQKSIQYWLDLYYDQDGRWTSAYEMNASYAQEDIDIAIQKIAVLQKIIEKQNALIKKAGYVVKKNKLHEAKMRASKKIGRPEKSPERQNVAVRFTAQWVRSLKDALNAKSCAQLEDMITGSSQRNWRRWLNGEAVPTHKTLSKLLNEEITQGQYNGQPLIQVTTTPATGDLLTLISQLSPATEEWKRHPQAINRNFFE
ncbi:MAG: hypothetical protein PXX73_06730 [Sideroxydans sp.]|nr:hypothetical protein [Sideroxydans sp.]